MSSTSENDTEILLGNKHLLAIFFVLAVLLGIAFTGGYMVGRNGADKKGGSLTASGSDPVASTSSMETHSLPPVGDGNGGTDVTPPAEQQPQQTHTLQPPAPETVAAPVTESHPQEATPKPPANTPTQEREETTPVVAPTPARAASSAHARPMVSTNAPFAAPQKGQMFLQVAAVGHTEAKGLADALSKKGFHAHAVAKPGSSDTYRVLIGPIHDSSELSASRKSLRDAGFTNIFVQKY